MKKVLFAVGAVFCCGSIHGQFLTWEALPTMPEAVSNNAVVEGFRGDTAMLYSFTGISSELSPADIHLKAWAYNSVLQTWSVLPDVPDTQGKIGAKATYIDGIIYLMGGYFVNSNFSELTSPKVHRFDVVAHTWLSDGANMPVPVDDHVQVAWRDSLIICVTGWSNTTNVSAVQIYNPTEDAWLAATAVPSTNSYRAFGASGVIMSDTIYYCGGTQINANSFVANSRMRKGIISPENPTEIQWSLLPDSPFGNLYRAAATTWDNQALWLGGSGISYNFDGLAYSNGVGVEPLGSIRFYNTETFEWSSFNTSEAPMDLRGIAKWGQDTWAIAGGMTSNQTVSDAAYRITSAPLGQPSTAKPTYTVLQRIDQVEVQFGTVKAYNLNLHSISGQVLHSARGNEALVALPLASLPSGIYIIAINRAGEIPVRIKIVHVHL